MSKIQEAIDFATLAHQGQTRKFTGEAYVNHVLRVADRAVELLKLSGEWFSEEYLEELYIVGVLHDTVEDVEWVSLSMIEEKFGLRVRIGVDALSKRDEETYLQAILRAKSWGPARWVKMADHDDNIFDLKEGSLKDKYRLSRYILEHKL